MKRTSYRKAEREQGWDRLPTQTARETPPKKTGDNGLRERPPEPGLMIRKGCGMRCTGLRELAKSSPEPGLMIRKGCGDQGASLGAPVAEQEDESPKEGNKQAERLSGGIGDNI